MRSVALSPQARDAALEALAATTAPGGELDVLVVGGGVVGAGSALDAATRGLSLKFMIGVVVVGAVWYAREVGRLLGLSHAQR